MTVMYTCNPQHSGAEAGGSTAQGPTSKQKERLNSDELQTMNDITSWAHT